MVHLTNECRQHLGIWVSPSLAEQVYYTSRTCQPGQPCLGAGLSYLSSETDII